MTRYLLYVACIMAAPFVIFLSDRQVERLLERATLKPPDDYRNN